MRRLGKGGGRVFGRWEILFIFKGWDDSFI